MTEGKDKLLAYDPENRLIEVHQSGTTTTTFLYDGDGGRVKKVISDQSSVIGETTYIGSLYEIRNTDDGIRNIKHIYAGSNKVCTIKTNNQQQTTNYIHSDHLGSSNVMTDETGAKIAQTEYQPYGKVSQQTGDDVTPYKFTGKELDTTGLYYYGARYYDPEIGRFISPDSIVQSPYDPQTLNRYTYCRNNPLKYVDPSGHWFWAAVFFIIKVAAVGAAIGGAVAAATGGDIVNGLITGAIGGALFAGVGSLGLTGAMQTIGHAITGAASGALGAVATGGDPGMSALIGGVSAGVANWVGSNIGFLKDVGGDFFGNLLRRSTVGAILGGGTSLAMGGIFAKGAAQGAQSAAIAYTCNHALHEAEKKLQKAKKVLCTDQESYIENIEEERPTESPLIKEWGSRLPSKGDTFLKAAKSGTIALGYPSFSVQKTNWEVEIYQEWATYKSSYVIDSRTLTRTRGGSDRIYGTEYRALLYTEVQQRWEVGGVPVPGKPH